MRELMKLLIGASEKAANIARIIRSDQELFSLLIEEKKNEDKNARFVQDFKTLADVLIQESLRWEITEKFPKMKDNIFGEENNTFTNGLGATITIRREENPEKTAQLLSKVIGGDGGDLSSPAVKLAEELHKSITVGEDEELQELPEDLIDSYSDIGIWIDPIDGTNEYIKGSQNLDIPNVSGEPEEIFCGGLPCVTVLIGAFNLRSGDPIAGVINQPFYNYHMSKSSHPKWEGRIFWGVSVKGHSTTSKSLSTISSSNMKNRGGKKMAILSCSENYALKSKLEKNFQLSFASGAGYKLLCVLMGLADLYVLSKDTTHFWDTCGPHAVLNSVGGGIIPFKNFSTTETTSQCQEIIYSVDNEAVKKAKYANLGGIIAYTSKDMLQVLRETLQ